MAYKFAGRGLDVENPRRVAIMNPLERERDVPLKAVIDDVEHAAHVEVYSSDSKRAAQYWQTVEAKWADEPRAKLTREQREAQTADYLAAMTVGWCLISPDGDLIEEPFTVDAAKALYADPEWRWLTNQVALAVETRKNFTRGRLLN